jgi:hypothetical protein
VKDGRLQRQIDDRRVHTSLLSAYVRLPDTRMCIYALCSVVQDDLHEFMRLKQRSAAEYSLALLPPGAAPVPRHQDALPEDGSSDVHDGGAGVSSEPEPGSSAGSSSYGMMSAAAGAGAAGGGGGGGGGSAAAAGGQPRVTILVFLNADWERDGGGVLRLWPPLRGHLGGGGGGGGAAGGGGTGGRRSPTSSDAGTTFSELSECSSLRNHMLGSTTSSVMAEPSCAAEHDAASLDGYSLADSEVERSGFEWVETEGGEMALDCAPVAGRCVLLLSGAVEHALLPGQGAAADLVYARTWCR